MQKGYITIEKYTSFNFIEKKSEFISHVMPVTNENEAYEFISSIKKKYYDATHNCYAYIIGEMSNLMRSSDDGEPSGTAGIPILEVIKKEGLTNTAIVVTRYFGGIMLGAGGLIRAYTEAAAGGVKASTKLSINPFTVYNIGIDYSYLGKLQHEIPKRGYIIENILYEDKVILQVIINPKSEDTFIKSIFEWTSANAIINKKGVEKRAIPLL